MCIFGIDGAMRDTASAQGGGATISRGFGGCLPKLSPTLAHGGNAWSLLSHGADVVTGKIKNIENTLCKGFSCIFWGSISLGGAMRDTASAQGVRAAKNPFQEALGDVCQSLARCWLMGVTPGASYRMAQTSSLEKKTKISKTHFLRNSGVLHRDRRSGLRQSGHMIPCRRSLDVERSVSQTGGGGM